MIYPPVGPKMAPIPDVNEEKTGKPIIPTNIYNIHINKLSLGLVILPIIYIINVDKVIGTIPIYKEIGERMQRMQVRILIYVIFFILSFIFYHHSCDFTC